MRRDGRARRPRKLSPRARGRPVGVDVELDGRDVSSSLLARTSSRLICSFNSKDRFTLSSGVTICDNADLRGDITIGSACVFHPKCTVIAMNGPIIFGEGCIVEENVIIVNRCVRLILRA